MVTPGRTAPVSSLTTPAMELWANDIVGSRRSKATVDPKRASKPRIERMMRTSLNEWFAAVPEDARGNRADHTAADLRDRWLDGRDAVNRRRVTVRRSACR